MLLKILILCCHSYGRQSHHSYGISELNQITRIRSSTKLKNGTILFYFFYSNQTRTEPTHFTLNGAMTFHFIRFLNHTNLPSYKFKTLEKHSIRATLQAYNTAMLAITYVCVTTQYHTQNSQQQDTVMKRQNNAETVGTFLKHG